MLGMGQPAENPSFLDELLLRFDVHAQAAGLEATELSTGVAREIHGSHAPLPSSPSSS